MKSVSRSVWKHIDTQVFNKCSLTVYKKAHHDLRHVVNNDLSLRQICTSTDCIESCLENNT